MNHQTPIPFGRYKGKPLIDVPAVYLLWLHKNEVKDAEIKAYIDGNLEAITNEATRALRARKKMSK